ncbi:MAG: hypothetical protein AUG89_09230 [Acidobacteria bacterium 13_1_20CM_4_56_7]|nr:MAG: hypothetical protein AUG89_09230 [Acidobacteria bacterium 13_1_20CM_4_56_7]
MPSPGSSRAAVWRASKLWIYEVVRLTKERKPYLEALLQFTGSRARIAAIRAPPFLVERQLAERVAPMLKGVRMSRTRLIASAAILVVGIYCV